MKEGKNFGIKLPVDAPNVQWKFYTTAGGTSKNQILDSDSDKLVIKSFSVNNEGNQYIMMELIIFYPAEKGVN